MAGRQDSTSIFPKGKEKREAREKLAWQNPRVEREEKGKVLYSAVSSPSDRSKHFTLFALPDRPVHSDTNSASPGSNYAQRLNHSHVHHCL